MVKDAPGTADVRRRAPVRPGRGCHHAAVVRVRRLDAGPAQPPLDPRALGAGQLAINITLVALLAALLVAGIVLALRSADRAMRLSEMKSDFVSNVSHELRTPLASIRLFAELLRLGRVQSPDRIAVRRGHRGESRRLRDLIENSSISAHRIGAQGLRMAPADLRRRRRATLQGFGPAPASTTASDASTTRRRVRCPVVMDEPTPWRRR